MSKLFTRNSIHIERIKNFNSLIIYGIPIKVDMIYLSICCTWNDYIKIYDVILILLVVVIVLVWKRKSVLDSYISRSSKTIKTWGVTSNVPENDIVLVVENPFLQTKLDYVYKSRP